MSTGSTGNGLTTPGAYPARTNTWSAGDQVGSADLNTIQDGVIAVSDALDTLVADVDAVASASSNSGDSPAPDVDGGRTIWVEVGSLSTTSVVVDDSIDWRDRYIETALMIAKDASGGTAAAPYHALPGDTDDNVTYEEIGQAGGHAIMYTEDGSPSVSGDPVMALAYDALAPSDLQIWVRSPDGALMMQLSSSTTPANVMGRISCSPKQNHY